MEEDDDIFSTTKLRVFAETLQKVHDTAVAAARSNEAESSRPKRYAGNSVRTKQRQLKAGKDLAAKGFLSIQDFMTLKKSKAIAPSGTDTISCPTVIEISNDSGCESGNDSDCGPSRTVHQMPTMKIKEPQ
jgi:primosomal replication protein N